MSSSSSSSSTSLEYSSSSSYPWNFVKPLIFGHSATDDGITTNRIAQTIPVEEASISISTAYCYLYGIYQPISPTAFDMYLGVYQCSSDGKPQTLIKEVSIPSTTITADGWYEFAIASNSFSVLNDCISFILRQSGGDENNYALWGYVNKLDSDLPKAFISNDASTWQEISDTCFGLKVISENYDLFDLDNFKITTAPATEKEIPTNLRDLQNSYNGSGNTTLIEYDGTILVEDQDLVMVDPKKLFVSFIIDKSGSMGWNDRFENRIDLSRELIYTFANNYNESVVFDMIGFGGVGIDLSGFSQVGNNLAINLDARNPTRKSYIFTTLEVANAYSGAVYEHNDNNYTIFSNVINDVTIYATGNNDLYENNDPLPSGTLTKVSGTGDSLIEFSNSVAVSVDNSVFAACGFRNLISGRTYNVGNIQIDNVDFVTTSSLSWMLFNPSTESPTMVIGNNGPDAGESLDIIATANTVVRNPLFNSNVISSNVTSSVSYGDDIVSVSNSNVFSISQIVDIVDGNSLSYAHTISNISGSTITFTPDAKFDIETFNDNGGIVQQSSYYNPFTFTGTTIMLLIKDANVATNDVITFYLQNALGLRLEWDFTPFDDWKKFNLYWLGDTATFSFNLKDTNGNALQDGTRIDLGVDSPVLTGTADTTSAVSKAINRTANIGDTRVYVDSANTFSRESDVLVIDYTNTQENTISSIGNDVIYGGYVDLYDPLQFVFDPDNGARLVIPNNAANVVTTEDMKISSPLSLIDVGPIYNGAKLPTNLLEPYDPPQLEPTATYDDVNQDIVRTRNAIQDIPSNNGYSVVRILPITEDILTTNEDKEKKAERLMELYTPSQKSNQIKQNAQDEIVAAQVPETVIVTGSDYTIESPVYLEGGTASSKMTSTATEFAPDTIDGLRLPIPPSYGSPYNFTDQIFARTYTIYPSVVPLSKKGTSLFRQQGTSFAVDYAPRYFIKSIASNETVRYIKPVHDSVCSDGTIVCEECSNTFMSYAEVSLASDGYVSGAPGIYASSGNSYSINYYITDKFALLQNGNLKIRVYSNPIVDLEMAATSEKLEDSGIRTPFPVKNNFINYRGGVATSKIDTWRTTVENNPIEVLLQQVGNVSTQVSSDQISDAAVESDTSAGRAFGVTDIIANQSLSGIGVPTSSPTFENSIAGFAGESEIQLSTNTASIDYLFHHPYPTGFYETPSQWAKIDELDIPIENGKATYTFGPTDDTSLIFVEASYSFGNGLFESICNDMIFVANPLYIESLSPAHIVAKQDQTYEIGSTISWMNNSIGIIEDGTIVTVGIDNGTQIVPNVSETINGEVNGIFIGPHEPFSPQSNSNNDDCPYERLEMVNVTIKSNNYKYPFTCKRIIAWQPSGNSEDDALLKYFSMYTAQSQLSVWATGEEFNQTIDIDLNDEFNDEVIANVQIPLTDTKSIMVQEWVGDGIPYLQGFSQPNNIARLVYAKTDQGAAPVYSPTKWENGIVRFKPIPKNQNVGKANWANSDKVCPNYTISYPPWHYPLLITTAFTDETNKSHVAYGTYWAPITIEGECIITYPPAIDYIEPLNCGVYLEAYDGIFIRDGVQSPNVVVESTWKGNPIRKQVIFNEDTSKEAIIDYPLPIVLFDAGIYKLANTASNVSSIDINTDIIESPDVQLESYTVRSDYNRTSRVTGAGGLHTHVCTIDDNGDGTTTGSIELGGTVTAHTHTVSNFVTDTVLSHNHTIVCAAVSQILPTDVDDIDIVISGTTLYDPTAVPSETVIFPEYPDIHRSMTSSLILNGGTPTMAKLKIDFEDLPKMVFTAETPYDTNKAFNLKARAYFSEYYYEDTPGHFILVPERNVSDGTRVTTELICYKIPGSVINESSNLQLEESLSNDVRKYLTIKAKAYVNCEGQYAETNTYSINVSSALKWIPDVSAMVTDPTEKEVHLISALNNVSAIGSSQLYDAVVLSANRMIDHAYSNANSNSFSNIIVLLSDGDENASEYSIVQAIQTVDSIAGASNTPIVSISLGSGYAADKVVMLRLANETGGIVESVRNLSNSAMLEAITSILTSNELSINSGIYRVIQKTTEGIPIEISLENVVLPTNASVQYRYRTSMDNVNWTEYSEWIDYSVSTTIDENIDNLAEYYEYEVRLRSNELFQSPYIYNGVGIRYLNPKDNIVFFKQDSVNQNELEYMASVFITQAGTIPETSEVTYGLTQSNSDDPNDYLLAGNDLRADKQEVLLSRYNELLVTSDYKEYTAINGRWLKDSIVNVYKYTSSMENGILVDPTSYTTNYLDGTINFIITQDKSYKFIICIELEPVYRFICKIRNYGTIPATIDHIGLIYNVAKRIPVSTNGTIVNKNISDRI